MRRPVNKILPQNGVWQNREREKHAQGVYTRGALEETPCWHKKTGGPCIQYQSPLVAPRGSPPGLRWAPDASTSASARHVCAACRAPLRSPTTQPCRTCRTAARQYGSTGCRSLQEVRSTAAAPRCGPELAETVRVERRLWTSCDLPTKVSLKCHQTSRSRSWSVRSAAGSWLVRITWTHAVNLTPEENHVSGSLDARCACLVRVWCPGMLIDKKRGTCRHDRGRKHSTKRYTNCLTANCTRRRKDGRDLTRHPARAARTAGIM